jgi:uncharacterized protein (DUF302 family)
MPKQDVVAVQYAEPRTTSDGFQGGRSIALPFADVVWRIREAIDAAGAWVLHEIDPQLLLRRGGFEIGAARQILFFHPRFVARMLSADPSSLLEAPLKFAVLEMPDGIVGVRWLDPTISFGRYTDPALSELGQELAKLCEDIITAAFDLD